MNSINSQMPSWRCCPFYRAALLAGLAGRMNPEAVEEYLADQIDFQTCDREFCAWGNEKGCDLLAVLSEIAPSCE